MIELPANVKSESNHESLRKIYQWAMLHGTPSNTYRTGRPPIFDESEKARLITFITRDSTTRRLSWDAICPEMGYACSAKTVKRVVELMGYHKRIPWRKFNIRPANKPKRVTWCVARLHWTEEEWGRILWTNESSFSTAGFGHRPWVIRSPEEESHEDCVDETFEQGRQTRMAWGGFCGQIKSDLVFIPGKAKLDSAMYVDTIMEPHLVPFWHRCCEEYGWARVVEDGAPGHKKHAISYRELNEMDVIDWPAQSPDLNLIEALWMDMETELLECYTVIK